MSAIHCPPKTTPGLIGSPMAVSWSGMGLGPTSDGSVEYRCSAAAFTKCASKKSVWARNLEAFECEVCFFGYWIGIDGKEMKREEVPGIPACFLSGGPEGQRSMETCPSLEAVAPGCPWKFEIGVILKGSGQMWSVGKLCHVRRQVVLLRSSFGSEKPDFLCAKTFLEVQWLVFNHLFHSGTDICRLEAVWPIVKVLSTLASKPGNASGSCSCPRILAFISALTGQDPDLQMEVPNCRSA